MATLNNNTTVDPAIHIIPATVAYVNATVSLLLVIVVLLGNMFIILIFVKFKKVRDLNNTAVTLLSICDLLRGSIVMTTKIYNQFSLATSLVEPICTLTALTSAFSFVFNPQLLALIAVIRYRKIAPKANVSIQITHKKFNIAILVLFMISLAFALLPIMGVGEYDYSISHGVCFTDWSNKNRVFRTIFYIIVIGIAFPVLTICYYMLFKLLKEHKKKMLSNYNLQGEKEEEKEKKVVFFKKISREHRRTKSGTSMDINQVITTPSSAQPSDIIDKKPASSISTVTQDDISESYISSVGDSNYDGNRMKAQKKRVAKHLSKQEYQVTKLMILIFIAYCVCWIPAAIVNIVALANPKNMPDVWLYIIVTMVEMKSALNPMIYGLGNRKYRRAFRKLVKRYGQFNVCKKYDSKC